MNASHILVTGAGGFIGQNLVNYLADLGYEVSGIDLSYTEDLSAERHPRVRVYRGDFRDQELTRRLLQGVDTVFHLASAHLATSLPESEYWEINVRSLTPLLLAAQRENVRRFVHVSSVGVYGRLQSCPATEETPCHPQSIYGRTKFAGELAVREFARRHRYEVIVLRPAWVYGPGCPRTAKMYRALRMRRFPLIGACTNLRHPVYIGDFLKACELAIEYHLDYGETFLIAGQRFLTSGELVEMFCKTYDLPYPAIRIPYRLGRLIARAAEASFALVGRDPPISRRTLEFFDTDNAFDISKAIHLMGYQPQYCLERGLRETKPWLEHITRGDERDRAAATKVGL